MTTLLAVADPPSGPGPVSAAPVDALLSLRPEAAGRGARLRQLSYAEVLAADEGGQHAGDDVLAILFFPYHHWNTAVENVLPGPYGTASYSRAITSHLERTGVALRSRFGAGLRYLNAPGQIAVTRDKVRTKAMLVAAGVPTPKALVPDDPDHLAALLGTHRLYAKATCGSMGKGIAVLDAGRWRTNYLFASDRLTAPPPPPASTFEATESWSFHDVDTRDRGFLRAICDEVQTGGLLLEEAVDGDTGTGRRWELRVTVLYGEVVAVSARSAPAHAASTAASEGGRAERTTTLPGGLTEVAVAAAAALDLRYAVFDVLIPAGGTPQVIDAQAFPALDTSAPIFRCLLGQTSGTSPPV